MGPAFAKHKITVYRSAGTNQQACFVLSSLGTAALWGDASDDILAGIRSVVKGLQALGETSETGLRWPQS